MTCLNPDCKHTEEEHASTDPRVCKRINCNCIGYKENNLIPIDYQVQLAILLKVKHKIRWILENCKFSRNFNNKYFIFFYWQLCDSLFPGTKITPDVTKNLTDPEVIRRAKQLLVKAEEPDSWNYKKYGPFTPNVEEAKIFKQYLIEEFVTEIYEKPIVTGIPPDWEN